eukprot:c19402_g1_i3.p1 GENE.c19402_g1_i3~~c19402_g1_i3.p1  ORF type:complete len:387 (+),score=71.29 c19402_g1_i3:47-1207(+)
MTSEDPGDSVAAAQGEHEDDLRAAVTANPMDYNTWTKLIGLVEQKQDIFKIREVYDAFLTEFPLCFGYWKKYAIHEQHNGDFQKGKEVFERGIASAGRDCNMWAQYASNMVTKSEDPEHVRSVFERAAEAVGLDYNSNTIWDMYLDFEKTRGDILRVSKLYRRIIQIPLGQVQRYTNEFKKWTDQYTLTQLLDEKELQQLDESLQATTAQPPAPPEENGTEGAEKPAAEGTIEPIKKSEKKRKREWIAGLIKAANERIEFARQRKGFEDKIKRPYFHFKPLDAAQLENWRKYLAFEMRAQPPDRARVQRLFERCLIACYNYVEFWLRFARFLEKNPDDPNGVHIACSVLEAAASGPLKRNPSIFIALASSYESWMPHKPGHGRPFG